MLFVLLLLLQIAVSEEQVPGKARPRQTIATGKPKAAAKGKGKKAAPKKK